MSNYQSTRREFLKTAGAITAAVAAPIVIPGAALGKDDKPAPSERIVMGGIGIGNKGRGDLETFLGHGDVQYVAVCDVRTGDRIQAKAKVDAKYQNSDCKAYVDFRELVGRDDIDAVHVATPDHWHAIMVIEACRSGKDVFCQKPETRTLREGPLMVAAARRYGRVVSGGSQRVREDYNGVVEKCWKGEYGTIKSINVNVGPISKPCNLPAEEVPPDMEWNLWLGPAPWAPYNSKRCSGNFGTDGNSWRSYDDYSGGHMSDWGAHHFGGATFAADVRDLQPKEVIFHDDGGKPWLEFVYPTGLTITNNRPGNGNLAVEGTPGERLDPKPTPGYKGDGPDRGDGAIEGDFIHCVKTREKPFRDIEFAVNTVTLPHLAFVAYTLQRSLKWDVANLEFPGDEEANRFVDRARRDPWHL